MYADLERVRIGIVGVGLQGGSHVENFLKIPGCRITAVCDIREERTSWAQKAISGGGSSRAGGVFARSAGFRALVRNRGSRSRVHGNAVGMARARHARRDESRQARGHRSSRGDDDRRLLGARRSLREVQAPRRDDGELQLRPARNAGAEHRPAGPARRRGLHAEGGYLHDLREIKFEKKDEGLWRRAWSRKLDGNPYPTHGLGTDRQLPRHQPRRSLRLHGVDERSVARPLQDWAREHFPEDAPERRERFTLGDVNTSLIKTALGRTIVVQHCTNLPRPYSRIHTVQGTKGMFQGYPNRLYIEGRGKPHQWLEYAAILKEFDHPLWRAIEAQSAGAGHGGMDYIEDYRLIQCLREGRPTDMNVYDAAALSAVVDLSVQSTAAQPRDRFSGLHSRPLANEPETSDRRAADGADVRQLTAHIVVNAARATTASRAAFDMANAASS